MYSIRCVVLAAFLALPSSVAGAENFRVDFSVLVTAFISVEGDTLVEIPSNGFITGSYFYSDTPSEDGRTSTTRQMRFHDRDTYAWVDFANESIQIFSDRFRDGVGFFQIANDNFVDGRDDPTVEPCTRVYNCYLEDRYRVTYQDGGYNTDYLNHLILSASARWDLGDPDSTLLTGLEFTDIPDLDQAAHPTQRTFYYRIIRPTGSVEIRGELTELTLVPLPEPSTLVALMSGLGALFALNRRRHRRWEHRA